MFVYSKRSCLQKEHFLTNKLKYDAQLREADLLKNEYQLFNIPYPRWKHTDKGLRPPHRNPCRGRRLRVRLGGGILYAYISILDIQICKNIFAKKYEKSGFRANFGFFFYHMFYQNWVNGLDLN